MTTPCLRCKGTGFEADHAALGRDVRAMRKNADLTLAEVARGAGYSVAYISDLERGRRNWREESYNRILDAIGVQR